MTADHYVARLGDLGIDVVCPQVVQSLTEDELIGLLADFDGMVAGDDPLTARVLQHAPRLKVIARWGVGMDNVDLAAAEELGIRVINTPGVFADEVADVAMGYLILIARGLHQIDRGVRAGRWPKPAGRSLAGLTLTIVGLGSIGRGIAKRALAMGMIILGCDISATAAAIAARAGISVMPLGDALERSEALILCSSLTESNRHLIDRAAIDRMPRGSWLINVARGGLVDEAALIDALADGRIGAAALDVFEVEPLPPDSPLRTFDQVILGSHNASNTREAVARVNDLAIENLVRGLNEVVR